uniref:WD_REPEATS_REGION domain-containing protein n=1 Tax=Panagrellus redivivus TaxID=6233 RepID=A0A7E4UXG4_PANRE
MASNGDNIENVDVSRRRNIVLNARQIRNVADEMKERQHGKNEAILILNQLGIKTTGTSTRDDFILPVPTKSLPPQENGGPLTNGYTNGASPGTDSTPTSSPPPPRPTFSTHVAKLELSDTKQVSIAPKNGVLYSKTTQTDDERISVGEFSMGSQEFDYDEFSVDGGKGMHEINFDDSPTHEIAKLLPSLGIIRQAEKKEDEEEPEERIPELSGEEKQQILQSDEFISFFSKASKVLERELAEVVNDTCIDYAYDFSIDEKKATGELLTLNRKFIDEQRTFGRSATCLDYSPFHPELIAAAHTDDTPGLIHQGIVNVWNSKFKVSHPEYTFTSTSRVTSLQFARFHSNLLVGGLYSGQICVWDNRVNKKSPVQKSPLSNMGHTFPVYSMSIVGSQNSHDLVTVSTDGKMCSWALDSLNTPIEAVSLNYKQKRNLSATYASFLSNSITSFVVGCDDGSMYYGDRHGSSGTMSKVFELHKSSISALDTHKAASLGNNFSDLVLTGAADSKIVLTSINDQTNLLTLWQHRESYISDIKWSPVHPAVFASIDIEGQLHLWNLNQDQEAPVTTVKLDELAGGSRLLWNSTGQELAVGDDRGRVLLYDVHESLSNVRNDEWDKLATTLREIKVDSSEIPELPDNLLT